MPTESPAENPRSEVTEPTIPTTLSDGDAAETRVPQSPPEEVTPSSTEFTTVIPRAGTAPTTENTRFSDVPTSVPATTSGLEVEEAEPNPTRPTISEPAVTTESSSTVSSPPDEQGVQDGTPPQGSTMSATGTTGTHSTDADSAGKDSPSTDSAGTDRPSTNSLRTDSPNIDTQGTGSAGTDSPGTDSPGTAIPGTDTIAPSVDPSLNEVRPTGSQIPSGVLDNGRVGVETRNYTVKSPGVIKDA
ncbi:hypothetical protein V5799_020790 [Amblyomma americanum]|uniref:Uncharacterized protein n=1 Tax=Amblyomma americanum TaxID=6943 RepID=A0AAQ4ESY4_AMBAM